MQPCSRRGSSFQRPSELLRWIGTGGLWRHSTGCQHLRVHSGLSIASVHPWKYLAAWHLCAVGLPLRRRYSDRSQFSIFSGRASDPAEAACSGSDACPRSDGQNPAPVQSQPLLHQLYAAETAAARGRVSCPLASSDVDTDSRAGIGIGFLSPATAIVIAIVVVVVIAIVVVVDRVLSALQTGNPDGDRCKGRP